MSTTTKTATCKVCPECKCIEQRIHVGPEWGTWWGMCHTHRLKWFLGEAEYLTHHQGPEGVYEKALNQLQDYREVEPAEKVEEYDPAELF